MRSLLLLLAIGFSFPILAQQMRSVDIALKLLAPVNGEVIASGDLYTYRIQAKNLGGDTLFRSDTIKVQWLYDGDVVTFNGADSFLRFGGNQILPGDSLEIFTQRIAITDKGFHNFCFESSLVASDSTSRIVDPNASNNKSCARINFTTTVGIASGPKKEPGFEVYPVPARGSINWKSSSDFYPATAAFYNLTGACVQRNTIAPASNTLDVSPLPAGIYQLLLTDKAGVVITRRVVVE